MTNRYVATLVGCALGDTLGMPVEPWKREQIQRYIGRITEPIAPFYVRDASGEIVRQDEFGKLRYWGMECQKGDYTDDTILTLAIAESIAEKKGLDLDDVAKKHMQEFSSRYDPVTKKVKGGFGWTTQEAMHRLMQGISPLESGVIGGPGNAPAMKMSPVGLWMYATGKWEEGITFAEKVGRMTHLDPRSIVSGIVQAHAVYVLAYGASREGFLECIDDVCRKYEQPADGRFKARGEMRQKIGEILQYKNVQPETAFNMFGNSGYVLESYPFALFMFQRYWDEPMKGLLETINFGGDCDTTGAIYGSLMGARHGMIFPQNMVEQIRGLERLVKAGEGIASLGSR